MSYYLSYLKDKIFGVDSGGGGAYSSNIDINGLQSSSTITTPTSSDITFRSELYQSVDRVRVLVIGDTGVGKSALVHLICNDKVFEGSPSWTVGCNTDVKIHEYHSKDYYIEFVDVGGSTKYKITRPILYHQISGIIVVYDLSNKISLTNVKRWIFDVLNKISISSSNWKLKETESTHILELENQTELINSGGGGINNNNNNNNNNSNYNNNNNFNFSTTNTPVTSNQSHTQTSQSQQTPPNLRRLNFINSHNNTPPNSFQSSMNITNTIRPTFLSQTSLFLPSNTQSPTISSVNSSSSSSSNSSNSSNNVTLKKKNRNIDGTGYNSSKLSTISNNNNNIPVLIMGNKSDLYFDKQFIENDSLGKLSLLVSAKSNSTFSNSSYNSSRLEIFYNKMIANLISNKRGGNPSHMNFNTQIYNTFLNTPPPPPPPPQQSSINNNNNNNNTYNNGYSSPSTPYTSSSNFETTSNDHLYTNITINNSPPLFNSLSYQQQLQNLMPPPSSPIVYSNNNNNNNNSFNINSGNRTPLRSRSTSFERSTKNF